MLWLAGMLGLVAIGGLAFTDDPGDEFGDDDSHGAGQGMPDNGELNNGELNPGAGFQPMLIETEPSSETNLILPGDSDPNIMNGGAGSDQINGYAGDDVINGGEGHDDLHGAEGDDTLYGGAGDDVLHGQDGTDVLNGNGDDDQLFGHDGDDTLNGGSGDDELQGGQGKDTLNGGSGDDALHGGHGDDKLVGGAGQDTLFGGWGNDVVSGVEDDPAAQASDFLNGGGGDDTIVAGAGDVVTAGDGADTIVLGDWIADGESAQVMDYDAAEDQLVVVWDMEANPDPDIQVLTDPATPNVSHIIVDGTEIALLRGASMVSVQDILLIDHASAQMPL